jgi:N-methylhydantoinase B/oxoprolinase/acetone carboxylase alpha subunit
LPSRSTVVVASLVRTCIVAERVPVASGLKRTLIVHDPPGASVAPHVVAPTKKSSLAVPVKSTPCRFRVVRVFGFDTVKSFDALTVPTA